MSESTNVAFTDLGLNPIRYGDHTISELPLVSMQALLQRGVTHVLGNEASSKVSTWKKKFAKDNGRDPDEDEVEAQSLDEQDAFFARIMDGTLGVRAVSGGVSRSTFDSIMRAMAKVEILAILAAQSPAVKPDKDGNVTFNDGAVMEVETLIDRRLDKPEHVARLTPLAEAEQAKRKAAAEAKAAMRKAAVAGGTGNAAEDLGL